MNDDNYEKYGFSKKYNIADNFIQLLISNDIPPPKKKKPEDIDFLVHINYKHNVLDDRILEIIEKAAKRMEKIAEKNPSGETAEYKIRIDTSTVFEGSNLYIRDEGKEQMSFMTISGLLLNLLIKVLNDIEAMEEEEGSHDEITQDDELISE